MNDSTPPPEPDLPNDGLAELGGLSPRDLFVDGLRTPVGAGQWEPPSAEHVARMLPQFRVEALIGHGGMGAVYRAAQPRLDRLVAIKLLPAELAANDEFVARFEREARTLARLHHPNIVGIHDFGQTSEGHLYFVMEFVDGTDLARIISSGTLEAIQALALTMEICEALQYAHSQHVIHRDIKPANVLVTLDGHAKLADFGLARPLHEMEAALTASHLVMGTPDYMAPEQRAGLGDHRVDIYALGVMLYEMLTGKRPHGIFDPPSFKVQVDVRLDEVVVKAMREEPERRYQQASEMRIDVDRIRSTPQPKVVKAPVVKSAARPADPKTPATPAKARRARPGIGSWIVPMAVVALLVVGAMVAVQSGWLKSFTNSPARTAEASASPESSSTPENGAVSAPPTTVTPAPPVNALSFAGHRYQFVSGEFTWLEAKEKAAQMGGHLATITSAEENAWVKQHMREKNLRCLWLGGFKESNRWQWVTGEPWQFADWSNGGPSGAPEDRLEMLGQAWNDVRNVPLPRSRENNGLLVEWDGAGGIPPIATKERPLINSPVAKGWISLLDRIDPAADAVRGEWSRVADGLQCVAKNAGLLGLPYEPAGEYDFRIVFTPQGEGVSRTCTQVLAAQGRQFRWEPCGSNKQLYAGFGDIGGREIVDGPAMVKLPRIPERNVRMVSLVEVRHDRVTGYVDGRKLVEWKTDFSDMFNGGPYKMRNPHGLGVAIYNGKTTFHEISVREVSGQGKFLRATKLVTSGNQNVAATTAAPFVNSLGMKFVPVPGTDILMCIHETRKGDYALYADANPGTNTEWRKVSWNGAPVSRDNSHPVVMVNWDEANAFCAWLSKREGLTYRLPKDREWSWAVGIASRENAELMPGALNERIPSEYPWGTTWPPPKDAGNYSDDQWKRQFPEQETDGFPTTSPAMSFKPNSLGIYDLGGNVWEWCQEWWSAAQPGRTMRGSSWFDFGIRYPLSSRRIFVPPHVRSDHYGFRVVVENPPAAGR